MPRNDETTNPGTRLILREFLINAAIEMEKCAESLRSIEGRIDNVESHRIKSVLLNLAAAFGETSDLLDDIRRYVSEQAVILSK